MSKVMDALRHENASIANVLGVLEREVSAIAQLKPTERVDYALVASAVDYFTDFPDRRHRPKEDLVFARLRRADPAAARGVGDLSQSRADLARELRDFAAALRAVINDDVLRRKEFVEKASAFIELQRREIAMEEARFFPLAERTLDGHAWAELEHEMTARMDPLIGGESGERFEALRRNLENWGAARRRAPRH